MRDTRKIETDVNNPRLRRMFPRGNSMAALLKLLLFTLLMHTACTSLRFTATLDAIHAGASSFEVGLMLASISFGPMFLAIAAGRWLDRSGPRAPMLASRLSVMAAAGCAILLPASDLGIAPLFGACVLTGLSFMLTNVVIQRLTGDVTTPKNRRFAFTALSLTTASSNLAAPVVAGYVIERLSYTAVYVWSAVAPLILSVLLFVPAFGIVMKARPRAVRAEAGRTKGSAADFLRDGPMRAVLVASVIISIAWEVGNLLIPIYAAGVGLTPSEIGWVLGSFAAATFIVRFVTPFLLKVVLEWHMIVLSLLLATAAFAVMPLVTTQGAMMGAAFVLGLGLGASLPNMMSLVYLFSPPERIGEAIGLRIMALNLGKSVFPVLAGLLGNWIGAGSTIWCLAAFAAGGCGYAGAAARTVLSRMKALRDAKIDG